MAQRTSFGPLVLVLAAMSCSLYVACGDDDYIIPPANGGSAGSGTSGSGMGASGGSGGRGGTGGTVPDAGETDGAVPDATVPDASDDAATSNN